MKLDNIVTGSERTSYSQTKIVNLTSNSKNIEIVGEIIELQEIREVNTRYGQTKVVNATVQDETGEITLVIWGDDTEKVREGDKIKVTKAYASEWNNKLQLNVGRFGKLLVL